MLKIVRSFLLAKKILQNWLCLFSLKKIIVNFVQGIIANANKT